MAYQTIYPYTGETLKKYDYNTAEDLEAALKKGDDLYHEWLSEDHLADRKKALHQVAELLRENVEEYAKIMTYDMGKLLTEAKGEVLLCADIADYYVNHADAFFKPVEYPTDTGKAYMVKKATGIIFAVEPWNMPYYQVMRVFAPNYIAGNPMILKHASNTPGSALTFEKLTREAGCGDGAFKNLFLDYDLVSKAIADQRVQGVALTGSERGGAAVAAEAGKNLKKASMELGGNDAFIVLDDADMDEVKATLFGARLFNAGQICVSSKRFIVTEKNYDRFVRDLTDVFASAKWGDPMDPATTLAPLSSAKAKENVLATISQAIDEGAVCVYGNEPIDHPGFFVMPTILTNITKDNFLYDHEVFGPVGEVYCVKNEAEAIALANDSSYGLGSTVFSSDLDHAYAVAEKLETGSTFINSGCTTLPELPFGGVKHSGFGRELADLGFDAFVNQHLIYTPKAVLEKHVK